MQQPRSSSISSSKAAAARQQQEQQYQQHEQQTQHQQQHENQQQCKICTAVRIKDVPENWIYLFQTSQKKKISTILLFNARAVIHHGLRARSSKDQFDSTGSCLNENFTIVTVRPGGAITLWIRFQSAGNHISEENCSYLSPNTKTNPTIGPNSNTSPNP